MLTPQIADKGVTRHILKAFNLHASHRLGQNFLISPAVVRAVVEAAEIAPGDRVLEIGPGIGTLTQYLAQAAKKVVSVEIDRALNDSVELCRKVLKPGAVPRHPRADETRNAPKWISYSVAEPGQVTLSAALDGETVFSRNLDLSRPDGLAVEDRGTLFEPDVPAKGRLLVGCAPDGPSGWSAWVMEVPAGFRFEPGKLVVPFHRSRIEADGPVLRLIRPPEFRYGRRKPGGDAFRFLTRSWLVRMFGPDRTVFWTVENGSVAPYAGPWRGLPDSGDDGGNDGGKKQEEGPKRLSAEEFFR